MRAFERNFLKLFIVIIFCLGFQPELALAEGDSHSAPSASFGEFHGVAEAWSSIEILPRADGIVTDAISSIGLTVEQGDVLIEIDPSAYEIAVERARNQVKKAQLQFDAHLAGQDRINTLVEKKLVAQSKVLSGMLALELARNDLENAQINLREAELLLSRTIIRSPIHGFISEVNVSVGDLVNALFPETVYLLLSFDPIRIRVEMDEAMQIALVRAERMTDAKITKVELILADGSLYPELGDVIGSSNTVNPATGKTAYFVSFPNRDLTILPGSNVTLKATYSTEVPLPPLE